MGCVRIALNPRTSQIYTGKQALRSRIGKDLCVGFPICGSGCLPPDWSGSSRNFAADLKFVAKEAMHSLLVHNQNNQVHIFQADLCAPAAAADAEKCWRAPLSIRQPACRNSRLCSAPTIKPPWSDSEPRRCTLPTGRCYREFPDQAHLAARYACVPTLHAPFARCNSRCT